MSQNLRVALWVPMVDPAAIGNAVTTTAAPTVNKRIASQFAAAGSGGSGGGADFATDAEVAGGVVENETISPGTLRRELSREFAIPAGAFAGAIALDTSLGVPGANRLVKTNASGVIDPTFVAMDGGTF